MSDELHCTRCEQPVTAEERRGAVEEPYCPLCHLIVFYEYPEEKLKAVEDELEKMRRIGVPEERLSQILWAELWRHAGSVVREKLSGFSGVSLGRLAAVVKAGKDEGE